MHTHTQPHHPHAHTHTHTTHALTRGKSVSEVENTANIELKKITKWAKDNKVRFNDQKSKVMLMTRQKRRERKDLEVYVNNKLLRQVKTMKYLGIILDDKLTFREHYNPPSSPVGSHVLLSGNLSVLSGGQWLFK